MPRRELGWVYGIAPVWVEVEGGFPGVILELVSVTGRSLLVGWVEHSRQRGSWIEID